MLKASSLVDQPAVKWDHHDEDVVGACELSNSINDGWPISAALGLFGCEKSIAFRRRVRAACRTSKSSCPFPLSSAAALLLLGPVPHPFPTATLDERAPSRGIWHRAALSGTVVQSSVGLARLSG